MRDERFGSSLPTALMMSRRQCELWSYRRVRIWVVAASAAIAALWDDTP